MNKKEFGFVGAGFTGLTMAYYLAKEGHHVTLYDKDSSIGGLAGSFNVKGQKLEKFYHHWFTNDIHIMQLIDDLGLKDDILIRETRTGMYYNKNFFKLSSPIDLLKFKPISFLSRIRLGFVVFAVRMVKNWRKLEDKTATEWLIGICGKEAYTVVWEPLLKGKFGRYAEKVSAVWFWNKLKLRGGSRGEKGKENLAYFKGGFASLTEKMALEIQRLGGKIHLNTSVSETGIQNGKPYIKLENDELISFENVVLTGSLPQCAQLLKRNCSEEYIESLNKIEYIGNVCLVLELSKSLSSTYWLNVNDPGFPFVGVIEHTNFEPTESYNGSHIVYLSKYLPTDETLYLMSDQEFLDFALPYLQKMFPEFDKEWILDFHVWREAYSQPVVVKNYSTLIPSQETPIKGIYINTMAQIYPEDRGTNYAVREGKLLAKKLML